MKNLREWLTAIAIILSTLAGYAGGEYDEDDQADCVEEVDQ